MLLLNRLTTVFIIQVRTLEIKGVRMQLIITWMTTDGSQSYARQTRTWALRQSPKMYRQIQSVPCLMPSCLSSSHCVPSAKPEDVRKAAGGSGRHSCSLGPGEVTTYIFVAIFVLVIMLVAVPAEEKMLRQGRRGRA